MAAVHRILNTEMKIYLLIRMVLTPTNIIRSQEHYYF